MLRVPSLECGVLITLELNDVVALKLALRPVKVCINNNILFGCGCLLNECQNVSGAE